jgi:hypothetical protein
LAPFGPRQRSRQTRADVLPEEAKHRPGDRRAQGDAVGVGRLDCVHNLVVGDGREQVPTRACAEGLADLALILVRSEDDDLGGRRASLDLAGGIGAGHPRELEGHQHDLWDLALFQGRNGVLGPVGGQRARQVWLAVDQADEPFLLGGAAAHDPDRDGLVLGGMRRGRRGEVRPTNHLDVAGEEACQPSRSGQSTEPILRAGVLGKTDDFPRP